MYDRILLFPPVILILASLLNQTLQIMSSAKIIVMIHVIKEMWVPQGSPSPHPLSFDEAGRIIQNISAKIEEI